MKKQILVIGLLLGWVNSSLTAQAQSSGAPTGMYQPNANYYDIRDNLKTFFSTVTDTGEGSWLNEFLRWEWFWRDRVDAPNSNKSGSFL